MTYPLTRYQPGQKVQIVKQERDTTRFRNYFNIEMVNHSEKIVTLNRKTSANSWVIEEDGGTWRWSEDMFSSVREITDPDEAFKHYLTGGISETDYTALLRREEERT